MGIIILTLFFMFLAVFIRPSDITNKKRALLWIVLFVLGVSLLVSTIDMGTSILKRGMTVISEETIGVYELIPFKLTQPKLESNESNQENIYYASITADERYSFYYRDANSTVPMSVSENNISTTIVTTTPIVTVRSATHDYEMTRLEYFWVGSFFSGYTYTTTEYELCIPEDATITYPEV